MKFYVTKCALTQGIFEVEGERCDVAAGRAMIRVPGNHVNRYDQYFHGDDFHENRTSAVIKAQKMQAAKLESLKKSMKRIANLEFK